MVFECYYIGFGQFIAALAPNELFASILVPAFFTFVASFCGVVVPYIALPHFWQTWMYWLTPFHYILEGVLGVVTHKVPIRCVEREEAHFSPPSGMTCQEYAGTYTREVGGYVREAGNGMCAYCQYSTGDEFVSTSSTFSAQGCLINTKQVHIKSNQFFCTIGCGFQCLLCAQVAGLCEFLVFSCYAIR